jgi:hypothetical protein
MPPASQRTPVVRRCTASHSTATSPSRVTPAAIQVPQCCMTSPTLHRRGAHTALTILQCTSSHVPLTQNPATRSSQMQHVRQTVELAYTGLLRHQRHHTWTDVPSPSSIDSICCAERAGVSLLHLAGDNATTVLHHHSHTLLPPPACPQTSSSSSATTARRTMRGSTQ